MPNMSLCKQKMPEQDPNIRNKNFLEVALGYTEEMAIEEAQRCLQCKHKPCVAGCPVNVQIPEFIKLVAEGRFEDAYLKIRETNSLPAVCGRVCPQESQCEQLCVRAKKGESVGIGRLERYVADWYMANCKNTIENVEKKNKKVAVIGSGPAVLPVQVTWPSLAMMLPYLKPSMCLAEYLCMEYLNSGFPRRWSRRK